LNISAAVPGAVNEPPKQARSLSGFRAAELDSVLTDKPIVMLP
jgi:hypothetical protein